MKIKIAENLNNVCFKKTWTNYRTVSLLWFVQVFLKQMLFLEIFFWTSG
jgi:hypothetical protein